MNFDKNTLIKWIVATVVAVGVGVAFALLGYVVGSPSGNVQGKVTMPHIKIYIKGEILKPGLYETDADTRLCELIEIAGGTTQNANTDALNLAAILTDGTTIKIPAIGSEEEIDPMIVDDSDYSYSASSGTSGSDKITSGTININSASVSELMRLPGVGESTAEKIVSYRNANGEFLAIEEIMNISGIGQKKFESMKPFLRVK